MDRPFAGRVAFVTGGTRGIGLATASLLAHRGADVAVSYFSRKTDAVAAQKHLLALGGRVLLLRGNVGNPEHVDRMFDRLDAEFGRLDFLINNAATGVLKPVQELTLEDWDRTIEVNVRSLLQGSRRSLEMMRRHGAGGRIIALSSLGARRHIPRYAALGAAKAAIESLVRFLAVEFAPLGVTVNCVQAGTVDTDSLKRFPERDAILAETLRRIPGGRLGTPEDIARVVVMLCGEDAGWIVGQTIVADGGYDIGM